MHIGNQKCWFKFATTYKNSLFHRAKIIAHPPSPAWHTQDKIHLIFHGQESFASLSAFHELKSVSAELQNLWRLRNDRPLMNQTTLGGSERILNNLAHSEFFHFSWPCCMLRSIGMLNILWNHGRKSLVALISSLPHCYAVENMLKWILKWKWSRSDVSDSLWPHGL